MLTLGLGLATIGAAGLFAAALAAVDNARVAAAIGVYAVVLPTVFVCALRFGAARDPTRRAFLRRLDHAAIFALIAATATPFAVAAPGGGLVLAALIWVAAAVGIFVKFRYPIWRPGLSAAIFGASGWTLMLILAPTMASPRTLFLILFGGVLYTLGIGFHLWRRLPFHRAIWHGFVVAGAGAQFFAVATILG